MAGMAPMLATPGPPPSGSGWSWEMKFDGQRCIARVASGEVSLLSRNLSPITSTYPEITAALVNASGGRDVVVDGEIVEDRPDPGLPVRARLVYGSPEYRRLVTIEHRGGDRVVERARRRYVTIRGQRVLYGSPQYRRLVRVEADLGELVTPAVDAVTLGTPGHR